MKTLIVGGGFAGLLEAKRLIDLGQSVTLVEKNRFGGAVASATMADISIDTGAEAFATADPAMLKILESLGLSETICYPTSKTASIIADDARYPIPHGYMGIPADLDDPELSYVVSAEALENAKVLDSAPFGSYDSVAELITNRLGDEFLEKLVAPVMAGVHSSSADSLDPQKIFRPLMNKAQAENSLVAAVKNLRANAPRPGSAVASLTGGMHQLVPALVSSLGAAELFEETEISELYELAGGYNAVIQDNNYQFDQLVIASGFGFASRFIEIKASQLETSVVTFLVESTELNSAPLGSGALITQASPLRAKATTHLNAKWQWIADKLPANQHLIRISYGLDGVLPDSDLISLASSELGAIYDIENFSILDARADIWPSTLVSKPLEYSHHPQLRVVGALVSGNGLSGIAKDHLERSAA